MLRLFRTTSFSFTLIYVVLFIIAVAAIGAYFYIATFGEADQRTDATIDNEIQTLADLFAESGPAALTRVIRQRTAWSDDSIYMLIRAPAGAILAGNLTALPPEALTAEGDFFNFSFERPILDADGAELGVQERQARGKVIRFRTSPDNEESYLIVVARDIASREYLRERSRSVIMRIGFVTIANGLVIGLVFSRSLLRRVEDVNRTARAIRGGDLSRRIPLKGSGDELDELGANLNSMLDQIERLMIGMRDVSDNIAHDLRSPLTRMRSRIADALTAGPEEQQAALQSTLEDADRMLAVFNALLSIARIQSGEGAKGFAPVDLLAVAEEMTELYEPAAQDAGFELLTDFKAAPPVSASRELISQAIANFLDNALKYAVGGSKILVTVTPVKRGVLLSVADDGPGVPKRDRERIFERFVRLEESRTTAGSGLGLSLVAAIARAHGAELKIDDGLPGKAGNIGLRISLVFPTAE